MIGTQLKRTPLAGMEHSVVRGMPIMYVRCLSVQT